MDDGPKVPALKLTAVQRDVLARLSQEPHGSATVGRGLPFKCNRITARSLRDLGLVLTDAQYNSRSSDDVPFAITLTQQGRLYTSEPKPTPRMLEGLRALERSEQPAGQPTRLRLAKFGLATFLESGTAMARRGDGPMRITDRGRQALAQVHGPRTGPSKLRSKPSGPVDVQVADAGGALPVPLAAPPEPPKDAAKPDPCPAWWEER